MARRLQFGMQAIVACAPILAVLGFSGGELVLVFVAVIILFVHKRLSHFASELRRGIRSCKETFDQSAIDAGESVGGIHGKPAFEALTQDNQTVELYDPESVRKAENSDADARSATKNRFPFSLTAAKSAFLSVMIFVVVVILTAAAIHILRNR
jgi:Sec-independent protein translocase protein TatA